MNALRMLVVSALVAVPFVAVACGSSTPKPTGPEGATSASSSAPAADSASAPAPSASPSTPAVASVVPSASAPAAPTFVWKELSHEGKLEHMKKVVSPAMSAVFVAYDGKKYKDFSCGLCHGTDKKNPKAPKAVLPKLSAKDGFKKHMTAKPQLTKFMMEKVVPTMASALAMPAYDPATKTGFGCAGCHVVE